MARLFDDAQTEYLERDEAVAGVPMAMVCWFNSNDLTVTQGLMWIGDKDVANQEHILSLSSNDYILAYSQSGAPDDYAQAANPAIVDTWHHACGLFVSTTDRRVFLDGGDKGTNATEVDPTGLDRISIGRWGRSTPVYYMSGMIAEAAFYDLSVWPGASASDKADAFERILPSLAKGFTPDNYPLGLKAYWPLIRGLNDKVGGFNLTASGTTVSPHEISMKRPCGVI